MPWEFLIQVFGLTFVVFLAGFLIQKSISYEEKKREKLLATLRKP